LLSGYYRSQSLWLLRELEFDSIREVASAYKNLGAINLNRRSLEKENKQMRKEKQELRNYYESAARSEHRARRAADRRMETREDAFNTQIEHLRKATSRESRRAVIDKFGEGIHHVEFTFILPNDESETEHSFIIETAPIDLVPHAVHIFLEQVSHQLWDKAWFYLNGPHILQAGPMLEEEEYERLESLHGEDFDERDAILKSFADKQLDSLAFPEYSPAYPHEQWTLGYVDRPGGPDWYINKSNNTVFHGPGGQHQHLIEEQADSCFAKVISGFDKLDSVFKESTVEEGDEWEHFLYDPVYIVRARIIDEPKVLTNTIDISNDTQSLHKHMHKTHIDHQALP